MNKKIVIGIVVVALIGIAGLAYASMGKSDMAMMDEKDTMMKDAAMAQGEDTGMMDKGMEEGMDKDDMMKKGSYEAYSSEKLARAETGDVVLFFHASWCPSCRGLNTDIEKNLDAIPSGVSILKVDYDTETELKKKYAVTYQHTLVQVDKDGNLIKKWSGTPSLSDLVSEIQ